MVLEKLSGTSFLWFIVPTGILFMLTSSPTCSEGKLQPNSLQKLIQLLVRTAKKSTGLIQQTQKKSLYLFLLNLRKKLTSSQSISRISNQLPISNNPWNYMPKLQSRTSAHLRLSKSKKHSPLLVQRKQTKLITLSKILLKLNLTSR